MEVETQSSQQPTQETKKRKSPVKLYEERIILELDPSMADQIESIDLYKKSPEEGSQLVTDVKWQCRRVRLQKSEEERKKHSRLYRKEYNSRPAVIEKNRANAQKPENLEKRALYAKKESTRERKKVVNHRNRAILKRVKQLKPDIYREFLEEIIDKEEVEECEGEAEHV